MITDTVQELPEFLDGEHRSNDVLDPFAGSGTTLETTGWCGRAPLRIELNEGHIRQLITPVLQKNEKAFDSDINQPVE